MKNYILTATREIITEIQGIIEDFTYLKSLLEKRQLNKFELSYISSKTSCKGILGLFDLEELLK